MLLYKYYRINRSAIPQDNLFLECYQKKTDKKNVSSRSLFKVGKINNDKNCIV